MQDIQEVNQKSFYYELKNGDPILQSQWCTAMAIDQNNEMVLMQQNGLIKCFQFKHNVLKILAIIQNPKEIVKVVMFLKNRSTFLSTKGDSIINWSMNLMQCQIKQRYKQKFYNPKNSLIYLRLKGREDLYKKQEQIIDDQTKPIEQDEYLEGLECINNLLIGLSKIKDKKLSVIEKQKILPLQIQRHRLDEKGDHHKESKIQKKDEREKDQEEQKKTQNEKQTEQTIKQQQLQEAQLARQIRHEKQLQEKEKQKLLEQRQVYKILTKKQINQGLILYRCQLRQKQKDSIKWLRYSEIALISKGESEIFNFEKRISDQLFMQQHKSNMRSVLITKQAMFDIVTIHYVKEQKEVNKFEQKDFINNEMENLNLSINQDKLVNEKKIIKNTNRKKKVQENQKNKDQEKQQLQKEKQQQLDQLQQYDTIKKQDNKQKDNQQQQDIKRIKNKISYQESDEEKNDEDLLDADCVQIYKITQDKQRKLDKKDKELKQQQNNQQQIEESKQIELNEHGQNNNNQQIKEQKKVKNPKIKECPLSRLETNDEIKKKEQINQKRKEKRRQEYQQYLNEIEQEQLNELAISKNKKAIKDTQNQKTNKQLIIQKNNKKRSNKQETENIEIQTNVNNSNAIKQKEQLNTSENKSTSSKSSPNGESIESGYVSSKRIYEKRNQNKKRLKIIEDDESEFYEQNAKQNEKEQKKKRVKQK
ncbi:unnamed protein product [Paramecium primaurelia]|uniref:Uncharacterized protein n=1 Tax=Paramecium primaurelia TaxID=5886 RepID=A0A8S1QCA2_PARPR|nr:unnamed protein product [Paramecium primaurelia]